MNVGIGLPATIPGATGPLLLNWAERVDASSFSSLGITDRVVYSNYEALITLAAAAAVTSSVRLMSNVLLAPLRETTMLAKQVATIDALSGGRLTLGLGIGGREDDFQAVSATFDKRGRKIERQIETLKSVWSGQPLSNDVGPVGPAPARLGGPPLLLGGYSPVAIQRVGRCADGFISAGVPDPEKARQMFDIAENSWRSEGREGKPRLVASLHYALGPKAAERGADYIRDYYSFFGEVAENLAQAILSSPQSLNELIMRFEDIGADEVICLPTVAELEQVDRLSEVIS
jgi:alkanesulfonate monooxygenase SsuD/methylene tetrahydromethanopterin reductase-like flavin-dependent oxidoreductase (luciferase family)